MQKTKRSQFEFIALMASLMSIVALSIDAILPALKHIGFSINIQNNLDNQSLITMIFLGLGFGQLIFGPLSDSFGRKPMVYVGFIVFVLASILCVIATDLETMLLGRILQGVGLSAPRTLSIAIVRDTFSGDYMAKIMSFIVVIFILVPVVAPAIGKIMLDSYGWKSIFYSQLLFGLFVMLWFWKRQKETLLPENKVRFSLRLFLDGAKEFYKHKDAIIYTLVSGFITGSFMVYLSASQHIFQNQFNLTEEFPYIFAGLAIAVGFATFLNGTLVVKHGMFTLVTWAMIMFCIVPIVYITLFYNSENPNITVLLIFFALQFFALGFLFGNVRSLAMQPIGHIAGIGAAINGFVSTVMAVPIATYIGSKVDTTALPLFIGFSICGAISLLLLRIAKKKYIS